MIMPIKIIVCFQRIDFIGQRQRQIEHWWCFWIKRFYSRVYNVELRRMIMNTVHDARRDLEINFPNKPEILIYRKSAPQVFYTYLALTLSLSEQCLFKSYLRIHRLPKTIGGLLKQHHLPLDYFAPAMNGIRGAHLSIDLDVISLILLFLSLSEYGQFIISFFDLHWNLQWSVL